MSNSDQNDSNQNVPHQHNGKEQIDTGTASANIVLADSSRLPLLMMTNRELALAPVTRSTMANPTPLFQNLSFDPEDVATVNQAYDLACQTLQNIGQLEVDREIIARGVLQAAESGERDANKLCERTIHGLTAFDYRQRGI